MDKIGPLGQRNPWKRCLSSVDVIEQHWPEAKAHLRAGVAVCGGLTTETRKKRGACDVAG